MRRIFLVTGATVFCFALMSPLFHGVAGAGFTAQKDDPPPPAAGTKGYTNPKCAYCPSPKYSKEGLKQEIQGTVLMSVVIGTDGRAHNVTVTRSLGYGLDEEAIKAVRDEWNFTPANGPDGKPAAVRMFIEVSFHLY